MDILHCAFHNLFMTTRTIAALFCALAPLVSHGAENLAIAPTIFPAGFTAAPSQEEGWVALPAGRPFPSLVPDVRDLKLGLRKNNKNELEADVGGYRSFAGWRGSVLGEDSILHVGLEGNAYFQMKKEGSKFPLQSSDGLIGLYGEAIRGAWMYQLRFTHISAHLSDGLYNIRERIVYTRETLSLRAAYQWGFTRLYAGYHFLVHTKPDLSRSSLQAGFYSVLPASWHHIHPYVGADVRMRDSQEGTTMNLTLGGALTSSQGTPTLRLLVAYLKGNDPRGQFYNVPTEKWSGGLEMDF